MFGPMCECCVNGCEWMWMDVWRCLRSVWNGNEESVLIDITCISEVSITFYRPPHTSTHLHHPPSPSLYHPPHSSTHPLSTYNYPQFHHLSSLLTLLELYIPFSYTSSITHTTPSLDIPVNFGIFTPLNIDSLLSPYFLYLSTLLLITIYHLQYPSPLPSPHSPTSASHSLSSHSPCKFTTPSQNDFLLKWWHHTFDETPDETPTNITHFRGNFLGKPGKWGNPIRNRGSRRPRSHPLSHLSTHQITLKPIYFDCNKHSLSESAISNIQPIRIHPWLHCVPTE